MSGRWAIVLFVGVCIFASFVAYSRLEVDLVGQDIYYSWIEGTRIINGENPYNRIHDSDQRTNNKYATYFPGFYELSALAVLVGLEDFSDWLMLWRAIFLGANLGIALLIFSSYYRRAWYLLGILACILWLFNRWTLYVTYVVHLDVFAALPLVLSLHWFNRRRKASFLLFGLSLAIKQNAVFLVPFYLIWVAKENEENLLPRITEAAAWIVALPLLSSIPFLVSDASGFIKSVLFSVTRQPVLALRAMDLNTYLELTGVLERLPILVVMLFLLWIAWQMQLPRFLTAFLVMIAFVEFNPVSITQYMAWPMALLPFMIFELYVLYDEAQDKPKPLAA